MFQNRRTAAVATSLSFIVCRKRTVQRPERRTRNHAEDKANKALNSKRSNACAVGLPQRAGFHYSVSP